MDLVDSSPGTSSSTFSAHSLFIYDESCAKSVCLPPDKVKRRIFSSGKTPVMSFSMKYNVNQDEVKNLCTDDESTSAQNTVSPPDDSNKPKKSDKGGSLINKYFKSFKQADKVADDDNKLEPEPIKDNIEKKSLEVRNESSGSPIKEYLSKFSKRSDSIDTTSETESLKDKDASLGSDRWRLFSDFKFKIAQAVEDIKSRNVESVDAKDKSGSVDYSNTADSEENSINQDVDLTSSTDNQVSSIASSLQNLSELSPPIISHSSTMTDMDMDTNSSDTNKILTDTLETEDKLNDDVKVNTIQYKESDDEHLEIESGVDVLEDSELMLQHDDVVDNVEQRIVPETKIPQHHVVKNKPALFTKGLIIFSVVSVLIMIMLPSFLMFNGFLIGLWSVYFTHNFHGWTLKKLKGSRDTTTSCSVSSLHNVPYIVEHEPLKKHEGWINVYMLGKYSLETYHISQTQTALMKLEGNMLRLSYTHKKIPKRALWDENVPKVPFYQHKLYNLDGAKLTLLPNGIVKKRYWSKKYPICITLKDKSKLTVYTAKSSENEGKDTFVDSVNLPSHSIDADLDGSNVSIRDSKTVDDKSKSTRRKLFEMKSKSSTNSPKHTAKEARSVSETLTDDAALNLDDFVLKEASFADQDNAAEKEITFACEENPIIESPICEGIGSEWIKDETPNEQRDLVLYLFARTGREKDEWYQKLQAVVEELNGPSVDVEQSPATPNDDDLDVTQNLEPYDSLGDEMSKLLSESKVRVGNIKTEKKLIGSNDSPSVLWTSNSSAKQSPLLDKFAPKQEVDFWQCMKNIVDVKGGDTETLSDVVWFNAIFSRIVFDMFRNKSFVTVVQERIQKKLSSLKLPPFMGPLMITNFNFGSEIPKIISASRPSLDSRGLWVDLKIAYNGDATMTLTTQLNLMSLIEKKEEAGDETPEVTQSPQHTAKDLHAVYESDLDDSAESSSEDEAAIVQLPPTSEADAANVSPSNVGNSSTKKIMRYVDKITSSKYFQTVKEIKYVKRAMEGVSNTDLKLSVEVVSIDGCLAINIPPPPSDRIWFGFRSNPHLTLKAKPVVGSRVINFAHVTNWIENKLCKEFEKVLVLPNMEDIYVNFMTAPNVT